MTGGRFDPTLLGDVLRAGYDRSFAELATARIRTAPMSTLRAGCPDIEVDAVADADEDRADAVARAQDDADLLAGIGQGGETAGRRTAHHDQSHDFCHLQ